MSRHAKIDENAEARRVADYMERIGRPISIGGACEAVGVDRCHQGYVLARMKIILGARLIAHEKAARNTRKEMRYTVTPAPGKRKAIPKVFGPRTVPADLWRGWINPATGIKPPRLGYDPAPATNE